MKVFYKVVAVLIIALVILCFISFLSDKSTYSNWIIQTHNRDSTGIAWAKFSWGNDSLGGRYFERSSMMIPAKIKGLSYNFIFQFDLGDPITEIYELNARSLFRKHPELNKIGRLKSVLQFWNTKKSFKDISITFGDITATNQNGLLKDNYGEALENLNDSGKFHIGTIGVDLFQNKILIIDYSNQRFAICDSLPDFYHTSFINIQLDKDSRPILPMVIKGKNYRVLFDNGSSLFPLLVTDNKINNFSNAGITDTIAISSWGTIHNVTGRPLKDSFTLGGQTFSNIKIYTDYRKEARTDMYDAMAGNALFWNSTIIIDFKNRKFAMIK